MATIRKENVPRALLLAVSDQENQRTWRPFHVNFRDGRSKVGLVAECPHHGGHYHLHDGPGFVCFEPHEVTSLELLSATSILFFGMMVMNLRETAESISRKHRDNIPDHWIMV